VETHDALDPDGPRWIGATATTIWMVEQFGLQICLFCSETASMFTSGTISEVALRHAEVAAVVNDPRAGVDRDLSPLDARALGALTAREERHVKPLEKLLGDLAHEDLLIRQHLDALTRGHEDRSALHGEGCAP
jgi:hypothetical protein